MANDLPTDNNSELERELDRLFAAYREAIPDPVSGPDFMPMLWKRIQARTSLAANLRRWAEGFVTAAAAVCLLLAFLAASSVPQSFWVERAVASPDELASGSIPEPRTLEIAAMDNGGTNLR